MSDLSLAEQRDRFLTFAFAASDVLIEVDGEGVVVFVAGSTKTLLGRSVDQLMNSPMPEIAAGKDRLVLKEYLNKLMRTGRASDRLISVETGDGNRHQVSVSGMSSPQRKGIHHLAVKKVPLAARQAKAVTPESPMTVIDFANSAAMLSAEAHEAGEAVNFTMYDVNWLDVESKVNAKEAAELNDTLVQTMRAWTAGGSGVGQVGKGKYSLLLDEGIDPETLAERIAAVAKEAHDGLDLDVNHTALKVSDLIDTDDFGAFFEQAMERFDVLGGEAFDLTSFDALKKTKKGPPPPSKNQTARQMARRKGVVEGWG